uniref:Uncharacterized protein n=1 Tax=Grammatophora oceanica TaxID=210454 RepID=A0A7S1UQJ5_9STRA|mmetsp:Transcript_17511/g.25938  ORF Transcript_17511/g.25938 Transcript_17511/m.25938 type:complete len:196 (+) Transcript_17511:130-717(+)|eukprot:CAMPEP_0194049156 /NCGR_PEP_ID=MMETSP0009_2-20130614/29860_1 /TAXON_ID=210454 /ORGANISM="Grammatophora oceanica, Strain CCMP 410" /LENGTH=195 /DNA_ID=CAMNT_0038695239 /DNA_START=130 /DNA_END=717 /DNA_ORIENTATION=+
MTTNERNTEICGVTVGDRAKWLQEDAFHKKVDPAERSPTSVTSTTGRVSGRAKWLSEAAFSPNSETSGDQNNENVPATISSRRSSAASCAPVVSRAKWLAQNAFGKINGEPVPQAEEEKSKDVEPRKVFTKKKRLSAVQQRRLEMERREEEFKLNSDPKNFMKVGWKNTKLHGKYDRKAVDVRGVAPKKSLADLP